MTRYERLPTSRPPSECDSDDEELDEKEHAEGATPLASEMRGCNVTDANDDGSDADKEIEPDDPTSPKDETSEKSGLPTPKTNLEKVLFLTGLFLPWTAGAIVSSLPFIPLRFTEAPLPLTLNAVASVFEVSVLLILSISAYRLGRRNATRVRAGKPKLTHPRFAKFFNICLYFLLIDPFIMGVYMFSSLFTTCAEGDNKYVQCGISNTLFKIVLIFRLVAVPHLLVLFMELFKIAVKIRQGKEASTASEVASEV